MPKTISESLLNLKKSKFRFRFKLSKKDIDYINLKGLETIEQHAANFVEEKLAASYPVNDGKQTPMHGHPVFVAMHATATCCRSCLNKWYKVPKGAELTEEQKTKIRKLIMSWIIENYKKEEL